jgi:hypothetical protein
MHAPAAVLLRHGRLRTRGGGSCRDASPANAGAACRVVVAAPSYASERARHHSRTSARTRRRRRRIRDALERSQYVRRLRVTAAATGGENSVCHRREHQVANHERPVAVIRVVSTTMLGTAGRREPLAGATRRRRHDRAASRTRRRSRSGAATDVPGGATGDLAVRQDARSPIAGALRVDARRRCAGGAASGSCSRPSRDEPAPALQVRWPAPSFTAQREQPH